MERKIKTITLHCSASDIAAHDSIQVIREWHTSPPPAGRGWDDVGYHFFIRQNGWLELGRPIIKEPASAKGHNADTIAICLSGDKCFSIAQYKVAALLIRNLMDVFDIKLEDIYPHHHFNPDKTCPNYDIENILKLILKALS